MGKVFEPPLCIDCKYYEFDKASDEASGAHLCNRNVTEQKSIVTGEIIRTGAFYECKLDRYSRCASSCGYSARYFKEKE